jgi:uncharacterized SAM-binding protein YcdF (DUF218 family)
MKTMKTMKTMRTMRTISLSLLLAGLALTSCSKDETISPSEKEALTKLELEIQGTLKPSDKIATVVSTGAYTKVSLNYVGVKTYSYTASGTYNQKDAGDFIKDSGIIRSAGLTGKGHVFDISFPNTKIKINTNYTIDSNTSVINMANPTVQDSYVYRLNTGRIVFTTISENSIVGEIAGTFKRFSGGEVSQGKITFEFKK